MKEGASRKKFIDRATCSDLEMAKKLKEAALHHIDGFNYMLQWGLKKVVEYMNPIEIVKDKNRESFLPFNRMKIWFESLQVGKPTKTAELGLKQMRLMPEECRVGKKTYGAPLLATIGRQIDDSIEETLQLNLGDIPIVVRSNNCHLYNMTPQELVNVHEDNNEFGGYFIVNGNE